MTDTKLIDSSVWIDFIVNGSYKELIENSDIIIVSALSIFEIKKKLVKKGYNINHVNKGMDFIRKRSMVADVTGDLAIKAVEISIDNKMPMADSIIYATALEKDAEVYTLDNHFRGLEKANVF